MRTLDFDSVASVLEYDKCSGVLRWKARRGSRSAGAEAGSLNDQGYLDISISGRLFRAHRIAWLLATGENADGQVDHINGVRSDNRIENLRVVTPKGNSQNSRLPAKSNKVGMLGVSYRYGRYRAQICTDRKVTHLGYFDTAEEAHGAYLSAKRSQHETCTI